MMILAAPVLVWMLWPVRSATLHRIRSGVIGFCALAFIVDSAIRAYLLEAYQAAPDSAFVQAAAANTTGRETAEYLAAHWRAMSFWSGAVVVAVLIVAWSVRYGSRGAALPGRGALAVIVLAMLAGSIAHLSKPWRRLHPVVFWTQWNDTVHRLGTTWADQQSQRDLALEHARSVVPVIGKAGDSTVVLVITDSINRDNLALYGYERDTTPHLLALKNELQDQLVVMRNAWSVDASTLPSLRNLFNFGQPQSDRPQHLLALARAAGYKVWWISNHDDVAIEQQHARLANVVDIVNRVPGRSGASLDGEVLDDLQEALVDTTERKLIVVHLMGAHPHYNLRFPQGENRFDDENDEVEQALEQSGKSVWVRKLRQQYDSALVYQDFVVSQTLQLTRRAGRADEYRAWMYLSDHGQEVGHSSNRAGHSPQTASGYRIPAVVWRSDPSAAAGPVVGDRPFRADWAGWTLADLLNLEWTQAGETRNVLDPGYRWESPTLPAKVDSFMR